MAQETQSRSAGSKTRRNIIIGTLAVLGLGAAGVVGTVQAGGPGFPGGFGGHGFGGGFGERGIERALKSVDATKDQRDQIWKIVDAARSEMRPMMSDMRDNKDRIKELMSAATLDRAAFDALRKETLAKADAASERAMNAFLDAAEVLTPEQRAELIKKREEMGRFGPGKRF